MVETLTRRPVYPLNARQFNSLGMIKAAQIALRKHGPVVTLEFESGPKKTLLAAPHHARFWRKHPDLFFKDLSNKQSGVSAARSVLGKNLLTSTEDTHWASERQRSTRLIRQARPWFDRSLAVATANLQEALLTQPNTPLLNHCVNWSRHISCDAIFGTRELEEDAEEMVQSLNRAFLTGLSEQAKREASNLTSQLLARASSECGIECLTALIMEEGKNIEERLESDVLGFVAASLHINALSLFWTLQQISALPEVQDHLRQEASSLELCERRISNAPYAFAVTQEAQRLRPAMAFIERQVREDFTLDNYGFSKGETVLFSPWFAHRDPVAWNNAEVFDPERFFNPGSVVDGSYFPFGLGPRACPGSSTINRHIAYAISVLSTQLTLEPCSTTRPGDYAPLFLINVEPRGPVYIQAKQKVQSHEYI